MNNRKRNRAVAKHKAEYSKREALHRLLDVVLDINGLEKRKRDISGDQPTAFLYLSGHVASVNVDVHYHGWSADEGLLPDFSRDAPLGNVDDITHALIELNNDLNNE